MADGTAIEWTDATWNIATGCTRISPGCDHCYIERTPPFRMQHRKFDGEGIGSTTGVRLHSDRIGWPLKWHRPRRIFVNSLSDLFHKDIPDRFIADAFATMAHTPQHQYQVLTKRAGRMHSLIASPRWPELLVDTGRWPIDLDPEQPLPNVWGGVTCENEKWARVRIPLLEVTPFAVRWLSCEPLLGEITLPEHFPWSYTEIGVRCSCGAWMDRDERCPRQIRWVVAGGESGPGFRRVHSSWVQSLRDQCLEQGIAFLFKQWGGKTAKSGGRILDGRTWDEYPDTQPHAEVASSEAVR